MPVSLWPISLCSFFLFFHIFIWSRLRDVLAWVTLLAISPPHLTFLKSCFSVCTVTSGASATSATHSLGLNLVRLWSLDRPTCELQRPPFAHNWHFCRNSAQLEDLSVRSQNIGRVETSKVSYRWNLQVWTGPKPRSCFRRGTESCNFVAMQLNTPFTVMSCILKRIALASLQFVEQPDNRGSTLTFAWKKFRRSQRSVACHARPDRRYAVFVWLCWPACFSKPPGCRCSFIIIFSPTWHSLVWRHLMLNARRWPNLMPLANVAESTMLRRCFASFFSLWFGLGSVAHKLMT